MLFGPEKYDRFQIQDSCSQWLRFFPFPSQVDPSPIGVQFVYTCQESFLILLRVTYSDTLLFFMKIIILVGDMR